MWSYEKDGENSGIEKRVEKSKRVEVNRKLIELKSHLNGAQETKYHYMQQVATLSL